MALQHGEQPRLLALAESHARNKQYGSALDACHKVLAEDATHPHANLLLDAVYMAMGRYRQARDAVLIAASAATIELAWIVPVIARLRDFCEHAAVERAFAHLPGTHAIPTGTLLPLSAEASQHGDGELANALLEETLRREPEHPVVLQAAGSLRMVQGRIEEAESLLLKSLALRPDSPAAYWMLSKLKRWTPESNHVARIRGWLGRTGSRDAASTSILQLALHKELDDLKAYDQAWDALEQTCAIKRSVLHYSSVDSIALIDALIEMDAAITPGTSAESHTVTPIFIVGMHRSGTTLMEQLIANHSEVHSAGEINDFPVAMRWATDTPATGAMSLEIARKAAGADFREVGRHYMANAAWRVRGKRFQTDKLPANFLNIGCILQALPGARIIHLSRDPMETCFSNLRELFSGINEYSYRQDELADYFLQYRRLMAHWKAKFGDRILDVDYAGLLEDPEAVMRDVADYCGLDYRSEMSDPRNNRSVVATASVVQVRAGIKREAQPKWRPYAEKLRPMRDRLRAGGVRVDD